MCSGIGSSDDPRPIWILVRTRICAAADPGAIRILVCSCVRTAANPCAIRILMRAFVCTPADPLAIGILVRSGVIPATNPSTVRILMCACIPIRIPHTHALIPSFASWHSNDMVGRWIHPCLAKCATSNVRDFFYGKGSLNTDDDRWGKFAGRLRWPRVPLIRIPCNCVPESVARFSPAAAEDSSRPRRAPISAARTISSAPLTPGIFVLIPADNRFRAATIAARATCANPRARAFAQGCALASVTAKISRYVAWFCGFVKTLAAAGTRLFAGRSSPRGSRGTARCCALAR